MPVSPFYISRPRSSSRSISTLSHSTTKASKSLPLTKTKSQPNLQVISGGVTTTWGNSSSSVGSYATTDDSSLSLSSESELNSNSMSSDHNHNQLTMNDTITYSISALMSKDENDIKSLSLPPPSSPSSPSKPTQIKTPVSPLPSPSLSKSPPTSPTDYPLSKSSLFSSAEYIGHEVEVQASFGTSRSMSLLGSHEHDDYDYDNDDNDDNDDEGNKKDKSGGGGSGVLSVIEEEVIDCSVGGNSSSKSSITKLRGVGSVVGSGNPNRSSGYLNPTSSCVIDTNDNNNNNNQQQQQLYHASSSTDEHNGISFDYPTNPNKPPQHKHTRQTTTNTNTNKITQQQQQQQQQQHHLSTSSSSSSSKKRSKPFAYPRLLISLLTFTPFLLALSILTSFSHLSLYNIRSFPSDVDGVFDRYDNRTVTFVIPGITSDTHTQTQTHDDGDDYADDVKIKMTWFIAAMLMSVVVCYSWFFLCCCWTWKKGVGRGNMRNARFVNSVVVGAVGILVLSCLTWTGNGTGTGTDEKDSMYEDFWACVCMRLGLSLSSLMILNFNVGVYSAVKTSNTSTTTPTTTTTTKTMMITLLPPYITSILLSSLTYYSMYIHRGDIEDGAVRDYLLPLFIVLALSEFVLDLDLRRRGSCDDDDDDDGGGDGDGDGCVTVVVVNVNVNVNDDKNEKKTKGSSASSTKQKLTPDEVEEEEDEEDDDVTFEIYRLALKVFLLSCISGVVLYFEL